MCFKLGINHHAAGRRNEHLTIQAELEWYQDHCS